jgi:hypothetical protein
MAKTRFRRKSHGKKNKTARRQKRQSRRMRGGENLHGMLQTAQTNGCGTIIAQGTDSRYDVRVPLLVSTIKNMSTHDVQTFIQNKANNKAIKLNDLEFVSGCN